MENDEIMNHISHFNKSVVVCLLAMPVQSIVIIKMDRKKVRSTDNEMELNDKSIETE